MKQMRVLLGAAALVVSTALITSSMVSARQDAAAPSTDEMMAKMMELAKLGPEHQAFAHQVGKWEQSYRMKWDPTATEWEESKGTSEAKLVLGGRYVMQTFKMAPGGMPMEGLHLLGFDNSTGEYISLWADTWSTWWMTQRGKEVSPGRVEMKGMMKDVAGERMCRSVAVEKSPDEFYFEMYDTIPEQGEVLVMSYTSKRVKCPVRGRRALQRIGHFSSRSTALARSPVAFEPEQDSPRSARREARCSPAFPAEAVVGSAWFGNIDSGGGLQGFVERGAAAVLPHRLPSARGLP